MDNTINYIFEVYDDMKIKTFLNYFTPSNQNQHSSTFYEVTNPTIQDQNDDHDLSDSDYRLSYVISMNSQSNDVFSPSPEDELNISKRQLTDKEILKLYIEGEIYDPHIKDKYNKIKHNDKSYIKSKSNIYITERLRKSAKVKSIPETNETPNYLEIPCIEDSNLDNRNTITFPATVNNDDQSQLIRYGRPPPPPPPIPNMIENTNLDEFIQTKQELEKKNEILFNIKRKYKNLGNLIEYVDASIYISRDLTYSEVDEIKYLLYNLDNPNISFDKIYYLLDSAKRNDKIGIRDRDNFYITCVNDHILFRYSVLEDLGKGCYGKVLRCFDYKHHKDCALKIIKSDNRFYNAYEKEVKYLLHLRKEYNNSLDEGHKFRPLFTNIVKSFDWRSHGVIVFNLYFTDLYHARLGRLSGAPLHTIMIDLIDGLEFLKYANILHLDLKPENVFLVDSESYNIKIGDFGLAKFGNRVQSDFNVQTCWYRSPEVVLNNQYSFEADLWSVGLIFIELIINKPVFRVKTDDALYHMMVLLMGEKPTNLYNRNPKFRVNNIILSIDQSRKIETHLYIIEQEVKLNIPKKLKELVYGVLKWDPKRRISLNKCRDIMNEYYNHFKTGKTNKKSVSL
jgi:dual specificity tyrosine-phosphorylation-regulated kinase 2/3/4